jgi:hypothetical protein
MKLKKYYRGLWYVRPGLGRDFSQVKILPDKIIAEW